MLSVLGFNYNTNYYFCTNTDPMLGPSGPGASPSSSAPSASALVDPRYTYDAFCVLPAFSYALHMFVFLRIYCYRRRKSLGLGSSCKPQDAVVVVGGQNSAEEGKERSRNLSDLATRCVETNNKKKVEGNGSRNGKHLAAVARTHVLY